MTESITPPESVFPVSVIMERRQITGNPWVSESWSALGVTVGGPSAQTLPAGNSAQPRLLVEGSQAAQFLWSGLTVELFPDEAESYYHNLTVQAPGCYVVVRPREDGMPRPVLVSVSFDVAQAYQEGGEIVYSVPLPAQLYRATEAFVLAHYVPEKRRKRRRQDWKEDGNGGH